MKSSGGSFVQGVEPSVQFLESHEEQLCEIILNLDQWLRRSCLKDFLSRALAVFVFNGAVPFMQFY